LTIGIDTDACQFENWRATVSLPTLTKTLRVFVDRKNYRLQDIQLSKNNRGASLRRTPRLAHSRGPFAPLRSRGLARLRSLAF
jgi:hypothetical protein